MPESATLTLRLPSETKERLALLANRTRRTSSFLAAKAIAAYVTRELGIVEATEQGRAEICAGGFTTHETVAREARAMR